VIPSEASPDQGQAQRQVDIEGKESEELIV